MLDDGGQAVFALPEQLRGEVHALPGTDAALTVDTDPHGSLHKHRPMPVQVINASVKFLVSGRTRWMTVADQRVTRARASYQYGISSVVPFSRLNRTTVSTHVWTSPSTNLIVLSPKKTTSAPPAGCPPRAS